MRNAQTNIRNFIDALYSMHSPNVSTTSAQKGEITQWQYIAWNGFYSLLHDRISFKLAAFIQLEETLIHELIHWTGSKTRLNRRGFNNRDLKIGPQDFHNEELMTEYAVLSIFKRFNFDVKRMTKRYEDMKKRYFLADLNQIEENAQNAIDFLTDGMYY